MGDSKPFERVCLSQCREAKVLEAHVICCGLENALLISLRFILIESVYLEVVKILNGLNGHFFIDNFF